MKYNPLVHHRRSIRLKDYDYSRSGFYFVTLCCDERVCRFGRIESGKMIMNQFGTIAHNEWIRLTERFPRIELDVFQIMPNHMHGIVVITPRANVTTVDYRAGASPAPTKMTDDVGTTLAVAHDAVVCGDMAINPDGQAVFRDDRAVTVGDIVGAYKSLVANACLKIHKSNDQIMGRLWQRNYWEYIIRDEQGFSRIRRYIENNPHQWEHDKLNGRSGDQMLEPQTAYGGAVRSL